MPEDVFYDSDAAILRVYAWGDDPIENWYTSKETVVQLTEKHGTNQLLVDVRKMEGAPSIKTNSNLLRRERGPALASGIGGHPQS